jgi:hypothetical protein
MCVCVVGTVHAHHNPRSTPIVTLEDAAYEVFVDTGSAEFDTYDAVGKWHALNLSINAAPTPWLSVHATTGFARVLYDSGFLRQALGLRTVSGGTDSSVDIGVRVWRDESKRYALSGGLGVEFPTGDSEFRLGGGHYALTGRLVFEMKLGDTFSLSAELIGSGTVGSSDATHEHLTKDSESHLHGAIISPHGEVQVGGRVGVAYKDHFGWLAVNLLTDVYLEKPEALGPVTLRMGAGLNVGDDGFSLTGAVSVPVAGLLPNSWTTQVGIGYRFGVEHEHSKVSGGCGCGG